LLKIKYNNNYYKVTDEKSQQGMPCWSFLCPVVGVTETTKQKIAVGFGNG